MKNKRYVFLHDTQKIIHVYKCTIRTDILGEQNFFYKKKIKVNKKQIKINKSEMFLSTLFMFNCTMILK